MDCLDMIIFFVFDLFYFDGYDLCDVLFIVCCVLFELLFVNCDLVCVCFLFDFGEDIVLLIVSVCDIGFEGLIGKCVELCYCVGCLFVWIKFKCWCW